MIGFTIDGRYKVLKELGAGGMGKVYEAEHTATGRRVGVKILLNASLNARKDLRTRFEREARTAATIDTKHICEIIDSGVDPKTNYPYLVMELMRGEDCMQLIRRVGPVAPDVALRIVAQTCVGLKKAHQAGVVHRDIKPANIFLAERDEGEVTVKLLDFGIAKLLMDDTSPEQMQLTQTGVVMGSPLYMSPEQARGQKKIDHRADLWSLGVVLYQLLCGRTPYQHIEALGELIISICGKPPAKIEVFAPWLTPQVGRVVHGALTKDRNTRFQTADDMLQAILKELPEGYSLQKTDLVGVPEADRSLVRIAPDTEPSAEDQEPQGVLTETDAHAVTESSMSSSAVPAKPPLFPARWAKIAAVAGAITAAGLLGVYTVQNSSRGRTEDGAQPDGASGKGLDGPVSGSSRDALVFDKAHPFRIIANSFSGYSTFRSERFRSMFERSEMVLRYTDETDHEATLAALGNGSAEIIATTLDNLLAYSAEGKVVALLDTTVGADAIVVNNKTFPQLTSLSALQQQVETEKLAKKQPVLTYTPGTTSEFLARLLSARLDSFDIDAFHILEVEEPKEAWEKLMDPAGQIAAAVLWEPYVTKAREAGYPVVLSSGDVPGSIQDVLVASSRVLEQAPEALQTFISNYYRHIDRVTANPQQMYRQVAEDGNLSPADAKSIVTGIRFTTALAAKRIIASGELEGRLNAIASVLVIDGQLDQPPQNVEELFDARFIDVAAENTLKLIAGLRADNPRAAERLEQGGRQDVTPTAVEVSDLMKAEVIGDLGLFNVGREEIGSQISNAELEAIAPKLADFSHRTTVVTLEEGPGTSDERELLRQKLESELRRRGLLHQVAIWGPNRAPSLHVRLRRRPED